MNSYGKKPISKIKRIIYNKIGYLAEVLVILILIVKFYRIIAHRYTLKFGEIDIIATRGDAIAFIEVKMRVNDRMLLESVTKKKVEKMFKVADFFIKNHVKSGYEYDRKFFAYLISWRCIKVLELH